MRRVDPGWLALGALVLAAVVYAQLPLSRVPLRGDRANWVYFAQVLARGGAPYRDVVNIKSPLSAYVGAAAIRVGRVVGIRDLYAVRVVYLALAALTVALTGLLAAAYAGDVRVGLLASLIVLSVDSFAEWNAEGVEPKTPMILCGLVALWAVRRDRPFTAGLFAMLSALSWQPGLVFLGAAVLAFSGYLTAWRAGRMLRLGAGAALPLALLVAHLAVAGALGDFYLWTIDYNLTVYRPRHLRPLGSFLFSLGRQLDERYREDAPFFLLAAPGLAVVAAREARWIVRERPDLAEAGRSHALGIAPFAYLLFCTVNFQGGPDLIPLLPFVGIFAAIAVVETLDAAGRASPIARAGFVAVCAAVTGLGVADVARYSPPSPTLEEQEIAVAELTSHLAPGDRIFVHGQSEVLVLAGLANPTRYFFLDFGKDRYLDRVEPGGFDGWFRRLRAQAPKIVVLGRMGTVDTRERFARWIQRDYEPRRNRVLRYFVRKDAGREPRT